MFSEDLSLFYSTADHAISVIWQGGPVAVIKTHPYAESLGVASRDPSIRAPAASFNNAVKGQIIVMESVNYTIANIELTGNGEVVIGLKKA